MRMNNDIIKQMIENMYWVHCTLIKKHLPKKMCSYESDEITKNFICIKNYFLNNFLFGVEIFWYKLLFWRKQKFGVKNEPDQKFKRFLTCRYFNFCSQLHPRIYPQAICLTDKSVLANQMVNELNQTYIRDLVWYKIYRLSIIYLIINLYIVKF